MTGTSTDGKGPLEALGDRVSEAPALPDAALALQGALDALNDDLRERTRVAKALAPLVRPQTWSDLETLGRSLARVRSGLGAEDLATHGLEPLLAAAEAHREEALEALRANLGAELKAACEAAGLRMKVVRREEPVEVRIAPFSVLIERKKGRATVQFARTDLETCAADATAILAAHTRARKKLETPFDPAAFFRRCWEAYRMTLAAQDKALGERVEILEFLPNLAARLQPKKFQVDPVASNFVDYSRVAFAFDVARLRAAAGLVQDGKRLNLGVATGSSASSKDRVLYLEDGEGNGEYKLTVFFSEA